MKDTEKADDVRYMHDLLRIDPKKYLDIINEKIAENPDSSEAYFSRHFAWMHMGKPWRAVEDLNRAIELDPGWIDFYSRGIVHRHVGDYEKALEDFARAESYDTEAWEKDVIFGLLYQADAHARLGDEAAALACCSRLPDNFWTPGLNGTPSGTPAEVADKLRLIAAHAHRRAGRPGSEDCGGSPPDPKE